MTASYDALLVVVSVIIAMLASYAALDLAGRVASAAGVSRLRWLAVGATVMGIGIWSMHFVGMLAFHLPVQIGYDLPLMVVSAIFAIAASLLALLVVSRDRLRWPTMLAAGLVMGAGISGMHYIGMRSMIAPARISYSLPEVGLSVLIAVVASVAALSLAFRFRSDLTSRGRILKILSAIIMGVAISGMHYTGMAAAHFGPAGGAMGHSGASVLATGQLAGVVVIGTLSIIVLALVGAAFDRNFFRAQLELRNVAEESLRQSAEYFRTLTEHSSEIIFVLNRDGTVRDREGKPTVLWPDRTHDAELESIFDLIHPDDRAAVELTLAKTLSHPSEPQTAVARATWKTEIWRTFEVQLTNLLDRPPVSAIILNGRDITNRLELESRLREASRMEGLGRLAGGVAHDFNNLLTVIRGNADGLLAQHPDAGIAAELRAIQDAADRGASLTRQLLTFSRRQVLKPRAININDSIAAMQSMLQRVIGGQVEIVTRLDPLLGSVMLDDTQIERVILNLAMNARDAMPKGGELVFETQNVEQLAGHGRVAPNAGPGGCVRLAVTDNGNGIKPEDLPHIFEPFFTTKLFGEGTGLGLATVYGVVQQAGGSIRVENRAAGGTSFLIDFPRIETPAVAREEPPAEQPPLKGTQTILLVEDQDPVRLVLKKLLLRLGYTVLEADGGEAALRIIADHSGPIDLLLTDVVMPRMGGPELSKRVLALLPGIKVAFVSGYIDDGATREGMVGSATVFIQKPFDSATLARKVREALA